MRIELGLYILAVVIVSVMLIRLGMGIRARRAVMRLASEMGTEVQRCWVTSRNGDERLEAHFEYRGYRTRIGAGSLVSIEMSGFQTSVAFALGAPDPTSLIDQRYESPPLLAGVPLFIEPRFSGLATADWFADEDNVRPLAAFECSRQERLYIRGAVFAIVRPGRVTVDTLSQMADIAQRLEASPPDTTSDRLVDGQRLPTDIQQLVPLIELWAVGDDVERQGLLEAASPEELEQLVRTVGPLLGRINEYLDSFAWDEVPEEAALVGRLAEAVAELGG
jgi:hypothetical protein